MFPIPIFSMQQHCHAKGRTPDKLSAAINALMADGWSPLGSPQEDMTRAEWIQAMVREAPNGNGDVRLKEPKRK